MDTNALRARLQDLRSSVTNAQLAMIGALSVIALVMVFWFYGWVTKPSYRVLASGQPAEATTQIVRQLDKDGVAYKLTNGGTTVMVKESDFDKAKLGVSNVSGSATIAGLELFDKQGFTTSEFQQRVDYQRALQGELTRAILKFNGITSATVQLAIPTDRVFAKDAKPVRASVLVGSSSSLSSSAITSIVELVSAAVPGLDAQNVTLTDTRGQILSSSTASPSGEDKRTELTSRFELTLASKAESMLAQVYGVGRISVRVAADLDFATKSTDTTTYDPTAALPVRKTTSVEVFKGSGTPPNASAGVQGSTGGSTDSTSNEYRKDDVSEETVVSSTTEHTTTSPGAVKALSAAAIVDDSLEPAPDPAKIKSLISAAIGAKDGRDNIVVQSVTFDKAVKADLAAAAAVTAPAPPSPLLTYIRMGVGALVLILVLLFLRKSLKTTIEPVAVPSVGPLDLRANDNSVFDRDLERGLPSELRLLDAEPDALANTLRAWVADRREVVR